MTATAVETADPLALQRVQALALLAQAGVLQDQADELLIRADLAGIAPAVQAAIAQAEAARKAAEEALKAPQAELERLEAELADCQQRAANVGGVIETEDLTARIEARSLRLAFEEETAALAERVTRQRGHVEPLRRALGEASRAEDAARAEGALLVAADADPLGHAYARGTPGAILRLARRWPGIVAAGDTKDPDWHRARQALIDVCMSSGVADFLQQQALRALLELDPRLEQYFGSLVLAGEQVRIRMGHVPPPAVDTSPAADVMAETWATAGVAHETSVGMPGIPPAIPRRR